MKKYLISMIAIVLILSSIAIIPHNVSATNPTITNYGISPIYGDVGSTGDTGYIKFWMTYTDADNDSLTLGYPKATKLAQTWPSFAFVANDTGDTNYTDGKQYHYDYWWYPVVGTTVWQFKIKNALSAEIYVTSNMVGVLPSTPEPYNVFPYSNYAGTKIFTFNYTSAWGYGMDSFHGYPMICIDGINYSMIQNDTGDTTSYDGKDYYYETNLTAGLHTFKFYWKEQPGSYTLRQTGEHWINLINEPDYNKFILGMVIMILLFSIVFVVFKRKGGESNG